jgi:hypothetical protein
VHALSSHPTDVLETRPILNYSYLDPFLKIRWLIRCVVVCARHSWMKLGVNGRRLMEFSCRHDMIAV